MATETETANIKALIVSLTNTRDRQKKALADTEDRLRGAEAYLQFLNGTPKTK